MTVRPPGSPRVIHIRFTPRKTRENPHKIRLLGEAASPEKLCALGFWDIPGAFSVVGEFARVGAAPGSATSKTQYKVAAVVIPPKKPKSCSKRGASAVIFWAGGTLFLLGVLAKTGGWTWFFDGEVVVDCW